MTTAIKLTKSVLKLIKVASVMSPASPEQEAEVFEVLTEKLYAFIEDGVDIGAYPTTNIDTDINEYRWATEPLKLILAEAVAPRFSVELSEDLKTLISEAKDTIQVHGVVEEPVTYQNNLPMGQGNRHSSSSRVFSSGKHSAS